MRAAGRRGGRKSPGLGKLPTKERLSLRAYLREEVDPAEVWKALRAALESDSQTAVVGAARLLVTELYEERGQEDRHADIQRQAAEARQHIADALERRAQNQGLEQIGLLVPHYKVEERAEQLAQERLHASKAEYGLPT